MLEWKRSGHEMDFERAGLESETAAGRPRYRRQSPREIRHHPSPPPAAARAAAGVCPVATARTGMPFGLAAGDVVQAVPHDQRLRRTEPVAGRLVRPFECDRRQPHKRSALSQPKAPKGEKSRFKVEVGELDPRSPGSQFPVEEGETSPPRASASRSRTAWDPGQQPHSCARVEALGDPREIARPHPRQAGEQPPRARIPATVSASRAIPGSVLPAKIDRAQVSPPCRRPSIRAASNSPPALSAAEEQGCRRCRRG